MNLNNLTYLERCKIEPIEKIEHKIQYNAKHRAYGYRGGTFSEKEVSGALYEHRPLTLDIAIPGSCLNSCYYCGYYKVNSGPKLTVSQIYKIIQQFAELGGKSIKILGEGEPLLRPDIFNILEEISKNNLIPVLFTCGDVLGNDALSLQTHNIKSKDLIERIHKIGCTVVLKFESWHQDHIVRRNGYSLYRNQALNVFIEMGFNQSFPTRLGFGIVLLNDNFNKIQDIYNYALENNIYPLICPLMPIGKCSSKKFREEISPKRQRIDELKNELVRTRIHYNIFDERLSDFPGGLPCDISRCGFYINDVGDVHICESDDFVANIEDDTLKNIWYKVDKLKNIKYLKKRRLGLCHPKRKNSIV